VRLFHLPHPSSTVASYFAIQIETLRWGQ
jgi:hypothetical protein